VKKLCSFLIVQDGAKKVSKRRSCMKDKENEVAQEDNENEIKEVL